jgi:cell fate regulator YaaT (PSP1 superfamily)
MYEHQTYIEARRRFPREGKILRTAHGPEKVLSVDIWRERVVLKDPEGERRTVTLTDLRNEMARGGDPLESSGQEMKRPKNKGQEDSGSE